MAYTVHILQAEHFSVPGRITKIFAGKSAADREAARLANVMRDDTDLEDLDEDDVPPVATPENWSSVLEWLQGVHGAAHCYIDVTAMDVIYQDFRVEIAWNDDRAEEGTYSCNIQAIDAWEAETAVRAEMRDHDQYKRQFFTYGRLISCEEI